MTPIFTAHAAYFSIFESTKILFGAHREGHHPIQVIKFQTAMVFTAIDVKMISVKTIIYWKFQTAMVFTAIDVKMISVKTIIYWKYILTYECRVGTYSYS